MQLLMALSHQDSDELVPATTEVLPVTDETEPQETVKPSITYWHLYWHEQYY